MNIKGLNSIVFATSDVGTARRFCSDFGLNEVAGGGPGVRFEALDGTGVVVRLPSDEDLPKANVPDPTARETIWGVSEQADLEKIAQELSKDRAVRRGSSGTVHSTDDDGQAIAFELSCRRPVPCEPVHFNVPGRPEGRALNRRVSFSEAPRPHTLGHVVYWSKDPARSVRFYSERLGFRITDGYEANKGVFARAAGSQDHHNVFFIGQQKLPASFQHLEFAFADVQAVMLTGARLTAKGWKTAMGPGRFTLGSNWYWYFVTPLGGNFEAAADMDRVDDSWKPGSWPQSAEVFGWRFSVDDRPLF
jgi:catechol 2,3-dioxygenase-like lactoylglutathione lyase family enzyme